MVSTFFRDLPRGFVEVAAQTFGSVMLEAAATPGRLSIPADPFELAEQLEEGKLQLGVFHGVEFAWVRERYPDLKPLCIAVNRHRDLYAYLVVRDDTEGTGFADLKGKALALPRRTREHCHLFLQRWCARHGVEANGYFGRVVNPTSIQAALDDVVRGKVHGAVVDGVSLEAYQTVKPGCHARLKVLQKSETFPAAVIAYRQGLSEQEALVRLRDCLINAGRSERCRIQMEVCNLTGFEPVPGGYEQTLQDIARAYPAPRGQPTRTAATAWPAGR